MQNHAVTQHTVPAHQLWDCNAHSISRCPDCHGNPHRPPASYQVADPLSSNSQPKSDGSRTLQWERVHYEREFQFRHRLSSAHGCGVRTSVVNCHELTQVQSSLFDYSSRLYMKISDLATTTCSSYVSLESCRGWKIFLHDGHLA